MSPTHGPSAASKKSEKPKREKALFSLAAEALASLSAEAEATGRHKSRIVEDRILMRFSLSPDVEDYVNAECARTGLSRSEVIERALRALIAASDEGRRALKRKK